MNRILLFLAPASMLLAAIGIFVGQSMRHPSVPTLLTPQKKEAQVPMPIIATTVPVQERMVVVSFDSPVPSATPPAYGTVAQSIAAYKTLTRKQADLMREGLGDLRRLSRNVPSNINTNEAANDSWEYKMVLGVLATDISGENALNIQNVPHSCQSSHRLLIKAARRSRAFAKTFLINARSGKNGGAAPELERQAQEIEASLSVFDTSLTHL